MEDDSEEGDDKLAEMRAMMEKMGLWSQIQAAQDALLSQHELAESAWDGKKIRKDKKASTTVVEAPKGQEAQKGGQEAKKGSSPEPLTPQVQPHRASPALPDGWASRVDPASKRTYYFNKALGLTQWEWPADSAEEVPGSDPTWQQEEDIVEMPREVLSNRRAYGGFSEHLHSSRESDVGSEIASSDAPSSEASGSRENRQVQRLRSYNRGSAMRRRGRGIGLSGYNEEYGAPSGRAAAKMPPTSHSAAGEAAIPSMESLLASLDEFEAQEQPKWRDSGRRSTLGALAPTEPEEPRFGPMKGEQSPYMQAAKAAPVNNKAHVVRNTVMNAFAHTAFAKRSVKVFEEPEKKSVTSSSHPFDYSAASSEDAVEESERRLDPDTDRIFTWREFRDRFSGELVPGDMLAYWRNICAPVSEARQERSGSVAPTEDPEVIEEPEVVEDPEVIEDAAPTADEVQADIEEAAGGGTMVAAESIDQILARIAADEKREEEAEERKLEEEREASLAQTSLGRCALAALKRDKAQLRSS